MPSFQAPLRPIRLLLPLFLLAGSACAGEPASPANPTEQGSVLGASDAMTETPPSSGLGADCAGGDEGGPVPAAPGALNEWLQRRAYICWARESRVHPSAGPHGGNVRVYLNRALDDSLRTSGSHPSGSVAVKELYGSGTSTLTGWAVGVKTQADSAGGRGWYWYEVFQPTPGATGAIEGQNRAICSNCHSGGDDFVLVPYPLR
jgi:hypothetical protein